MVCSLIPKLFPPRTGLSWSPAPGIAGWLLPLILVLKLFFISTVFLFPGCVPSSPCVCGQEWDLFQPSFAKLCKAHLIKHFPQLWAEFITPGQKGSQCPSKVTPALGASATNPSLFLMESSFQPCPRTITSFFCCYPLLSSSILVSWPLCSVRFLFLHTDKSIFRCPSNSLVPWQWHFWGDVAVKSISGRFLS